MRILFLVPGAFGISGGIARYCRLVCKALSEASEVSQIDVIARNDPIGHTADEYYLSPSHSNYYPTGSRKIHFLKEFFRKAGKYDIYLSGHTNLTPLLYPLRTIYSSSALVSLIYGIEVWQHRPFPVRYSLAQSDLILSISRFTATKAAKANGVEQHLVRILPNCLDPRFVIEPLDNPSKLKLKLQSPNLLTVARLERTERYKGHEQVIRALPNVLAQFPNTQYYVVGKGDLIDELRSLSQKLGIAEHVHFLGYLSHQELMAVYQQSDIFIMPSRKEGFGFVFLEAMAYAKPVIAGNRDASVEVVKDGETGLLVNPTNPSEIGDAIHQLLSNPRVRHSYGQAGAKRVAEKFHFETFKTTLLDYLQEGR